MEYPPFFFFLAYTAFEWACGADKVLATALTWIAWEVWKEKAFARHKWALEQDSSLTSGINKASLNRRRVLKTVWSKIMVHHNGIHVCHKDSILGEEPQTEAYWWKGLELLCCFRSCATVQSLSQLLYSTVHHIKWFLRLWSHLSKSWSWNGSNVIWSSGVARGWL